MNVADTIRTSGANLARRKGRTALTAAGVVVGVAALVLMISLGLGIERQFLSIFQTEDALRTLTVTRPKPDAPKKKGPRFNPFMLGAQMLPITDKDLADIRAIPGVEAARPELNLILRVSIDLPGDPSGGDFFPVGGVPPEDENRFEKNLVSGRIWTSPSRKECLLPSLLLKHLNAGLEEVVGHKVTFDALMPDEEDVTEKEEYVVSGVFDSDRFGFRERQIFVPLERALELREQKGGRFQSSKKGTYLEAEVRVSHPKMIDAVKRQLTQSGYAVTSTLDIVRGLKIGFLVLEGFMACIGAIGLIVALFGIANTMAMAVLERTREIGIMKALGARNRDIGRLFLAEAAAIGALGGGAGLGIAFLIGKLLNAIARAAFDMPGDIRLFYVSPLLALGSVLFAMLVSVIAGTLPARRAARLDPVEALRYQ